MAHSINQALPPEAQRLQRRYLHECQNVGLLLDKFAPWGLDQRGNWDLVMQVRRQPRHQRPATVNGGEAKGYWLKTTRRNNNDDETDSLFQVSRTDGALVEAQWQRLQRAVTRAGGLTFTMQTANRVVVGLGASHVLETSITLDRNSGLPIIPGSTLKGLARTQALFEMAGSLGVALQKINSFSELLEEDELNTEKIQQVCELELAQADAETLTFFRQLFGYVGYAGDVSFVQAVYADRETEWYEADVMTPHFPKYYDNASSPPRDDDQPNPVSFLTVKAGMRFAFGLIPMRPNKPNIADRLQTAEDTLRQGLRDLGVGGKTAADYGFFR